MRVLSKDLLATNGQKMIVSDWSEPFKITYTTTDGDEKTLNNFNLVYCNNLGIYLFSGQDEWVSPNNGLQWLYDGTISGNKWAYRLSIGSYCQFAILDVTHYATKTGTLSWGNPVAFSTKNSWANCKWYDVIPDSNNSNFLIVGSKLVSGKYVGVYVTYNQSNFGTSWSFDTPKTIATNAIRKALRVAGNKVIVVGDEGYIALAKGVYIDTSTNWNIHQVGDGTINWEYVAYGNGLFIVASQDGYITISDDDGETWTEPVQNTGLETIRGITFAVNRFFLCGYSKIVTTPDGKNFKTNKIISTSEANPNQPNWDYIGYNGNVVVVASKSTGYMALKTWRK